MNRTQICPIIFADIVGSSKITDDRLKTDLNRFVHRLLDEIEGRFQVLLTKHTGDGFFICGVDGTEMAEAALTVKDRFRNTDWIRLGFSDSVTIRIGLDLQKVNLIEEGGKIIDVSSGGIDRAARIEPVVAPNEVWCSDHFFSQLHRENVRNIGGTSIGKKQLAKGAGEANLFALHWAHEAIPQPAPQTAEPPPVRNGIAISIPRIKRSISDAERDQFAVEAMQEISTYFQEALGVLERDQHPHVQCRHTPVTPHKFTAEVYVDGKSVGRCKIWLSGRGREICYSQGSFQIDQDNGYNESLLVEDDGRDIYLKAMGMAMIARGRESLNVKNAAMYLWEVFTRPLSQ
ncbi:hypothetical protein [Magnetospirillum sp. 15-1]|uniref:hypothetical protein n=1 Tax=Magnetospirillum sp. 15-1 TaxID=1979370 RepID=UPI000BBCE0F6|nr:hypothetical protein [Magnetospirillum sp. 15-1]